MFTLYKGDKKRRRLIKKSPACGEKSAKKALELDQGCDKAELLSALKNAHFNSEERLMRELDQNMRNETNTIQNDIVKLVHFYSSFLKKKSSYCDR